MAHIDPPDAAELPSLARLRAATAAVLALAIGIYYAIVLPAEKGIDPTGVGRAIGLLEMGEIKQDIAAEALADSIDAIARREADSAWVVDSLQAMTLPVSPGGAGKTDTIRVKIPGKGSGEAMLRMEEGAWARYSWRADRGVLDADVRGDSAGAPEHWLHRYAYSSADSSSVGVIRAAFRGEHGIIWQNFGDLSVTVTFIVFGTHDGVRSRP
jgi:hypothetical protein